MSRFSKDYPSNVSHRVSQWLVSNAKNKSVWLIASFILLALSIALLSSPTRALAGKRLLHEAWTTVASVTKLEKLAGITNLKSKSAAATKLTAVAAKNPILGTAKLNIARQGHAAITLSDGKILIVGGENANGLIKESEIYNPATRMFMVADSSITARTEPTATSLPDGRILIAGGRGQAQALRTTEIYDYGRNVFTQGPALNRPRAGHSATKLADGRILIAGGSADGSAEIFDPATQTFSLVSGRLNAARSLHGSVLLANGKALLAGGKLANGNALNSAEVFDPATQTFTAVGNMRGSRVRPLLNILRDGKVQVIGGDTSETMEMYNAGGQYFTAYAHLPNNDATMRTPGRAALFHRKAKKQASAQSLQFTTAAVRESVREEAAPPADPLDREGSTTSETSGTAVTTGGTDSTDTTLSSAVLTESTVASVTTDKTDYAPGEVATITGTGFLPNQVVNILLERDPPTPATTTLEARTDEAGNFTTTYNVVETDLNVSFILTASGQPDNYPVAQTTFTDGNVSAATLTIKASDCSTNNTSFSYNDTVCANVAWTTVNPGNTDIIIQWLNPSSTLTYSTTFSRATPGSSSNNDSRMANALGTWTVRACKNVGCSGSNLITSTTFTVAAKPLTVTGITASNKVYNGNTTATLNTGSAALVGVVSGDSVTLNTGSAVGTFDNKNVGTGKTVTVSGLTISGADAGKYTLTQPTTTANITAKVLTETGLSASNKIYDATTTATLTGTAALLASEAAGSGTSSDGKPYTGDAVSVTGTPTGTFASKNVANAISITISGTSLTGAQAGNYTLTQQTGLTANITARTLTVSAAGVNKIYDGTKTATVTLSDDRASGDVLTTSYTSASFADKHVGIGKTVSVSGIAISGMDAGNYTANTTASTTANITTLGITVTAVPSTKTYDGTTNSTGTPTIAPSLASGDAPGFTQSYDNRNVGTGKTLTPAGAVNDGNGGSNYSVTFANSTAGVITTRPITVTAATDNKSYDGMTASASVPTITSGSLVGGDTAGFTQVFSTKHVGTNKTLTPSGSISDGNSGNNYSVTFANNTTGVITARAITVTAATNTKAYDGTTSAAATPTITVGSLTAGDTASLSESYDTRHAGTGKTLTPSGTITDGNSGNNYAVTFVNDSTGVINARAITVTAASDSKGYDGTTSSSGTPTITSGNLVSGDTASFTQSFDSKNAGARTLTPTGSVTDGNGGNNYAITFATVSGSITARPLTVTATGVNKTYDGTTSATVTLSDNRISGDVFTSSYTSASFANKNVGTGKAVSVSGISISGADAGNYSANATASTMADITPRALTVSATGINKPYDGNANATVTLSDDRVAGDNLATSYASASFNNKNVGTGKPVSVSGISISGADTSNYTANATASTTADITVATVSPVITANNKVYDGNNSATITTRSLTGVIGSDAVTLTGGTASFADKNVGTAKLVTATGLGLTGGDAGNYVLSSTSATTTADITSLGITGSISAASKTYDGTAAASILTQTLSGVVMGDVVSYVGGTASFSDKNIGTGKTVTATGLGLSGADAGNYTVNSTATTTANIAPRTLTVTASASNKVYDSTTAATVSLSDDRVSGDVLTVSYTSATFANKNVGTGKTVTVSGISITTGDAGNYSLASNTATATANITALGITGSITVSSKGYDATTSATIATRTLAGVLGSDDVTYTGGTATFDNKNVGTGKTVNATGLNLSGGDAGNYTVNATATTTADITALAITGSIAANNKVYDGTTAATIASRTLSGVISGDTVSYAGGTATFADKHVGTGKTVTGTGLSLSGGDAGNYTVNATATTTANITQRGLTISAVTNTKVYDGNVSAAATPTVTGLQTGDTVTGLSETYDNATAGTGKTLSVASYTVNDGNSGGNYNANTVPNTTGVINPAGTAVTTVTVTPTSQQYSDKVNLSATTASSPGIGGSVEFFINGTSALQSLGSVNVAANGTATLTGVALLETVAGAMAPGAHTVTAKFTPSNLINYTVSSNTTPLTITQEDATAYYAGPAYFATASPNSTSATVTLSATVVDASDGARGDIRKAIVEFHRDSPTGALIGSAANVGLVNNADLTVGTATTTFTYNLSGSEVNSNGTALNVYVVVKGYYTYSDTQPTVVTVTIPGTDSVNGGGHLVLTASSGQYAGAATSKMNFGYTMKYNSSGKNLQGQVNVIVRATDGKVYQIKGNAIDSLAVIGTTYPKGGTFVTKANMTDITNPLLPVSLGGNLKLQVEMTDAALGGQTDKVGVTLWNSAGGLWFSSNWTGTTSVQQLLGGGNISVR